MSDVTDDTGYTIENVDPSGAPVAVDSAHYEIHAGHSFYYHDVIQLAAAGTQDYLLTVPAGCRPHWDYTVEGIYGVTVELYEGTGKTQSASAQATFNRDRNSATAAALVVKKGTNGGSGDGTRVLWRKSGSGTSQGRVAGSSAEHRERILKADTAYILRITSAANTNDISLDLGWYE